MNKTTKRRIPVNVIAGPLGVGKTTTINHLLRLKPDTEKWAILVNEYGLVGLDEALMQPSEIRPRTSGIDIREVAGGCICCSAGFMFEVSLVLLLQRKPDRLLIEPTGLAALSGILDTLDRPGIRESVDVRSILCLLDPKRLETDCLRDEVKDQIEAADVLFASRADLTTPAEMDGFMAWANELFPPKRHVQAIEHGEVALDILDLVAEREVPVDRAGHQHGTDHHHDHDAHGSHHHHDHGHHGHDVHSHDGHHQHHGSNTDGEDATQGHDEVTCDASHPMLRRVHLSPTASTVGWIFWHEWIFQSDRVSRWVSDLAQRPKVLRTKAVLRTEQGWHGYNLTEGVEEIRPTGYRRDSRLEFIVDGDDVPDIEWVEDSLRACLLESAK